MIWYHRNARGFSLIVSERNGTNHRNQTPQVSSCERIPDTSMITVFQGWTRASRYDWWVLLEEKRNMKAYSRAARCMVKCHEMDGV